MQQPLFPQLDFVTEAAARRSLQPVEPYLWRAIMEPWEDFKVSRAEDRRFLRMDHTNVAHWLNHQINITATDISDQYPDLQLRHRVVNQQEHFILGEEAVIVFKKVTRRFRRRNGTTHFERSNYLTDRNKRRWRQEKQENFPDLPRFIAAYELVREMTGIRLYVGYPRTLARGFRWLYEMGDYSEMLIGPAVAPSHDPSQDDSHKDFEVLPRKESEESGRQ